VAPVRPVPDQRKAARLAVSLCRMSPALRGLDCPADAPGLHRWNSCQATRQTDPLADLDVEPALDRDRTWRCAGVLCERAQAVATGVQRLEIAAVQCGMGLSSKSECAFPPMHSCWRLGTVVVPSLIGLHAAARPVAVLADPGALPPCSDTGQGNGRARVLASSTGIKHMLRLPWPMAREGK